MKVRYNDVFLHFLTKYDLSADFSFSYAIPTEIQKILDSNICQNDLGITLTSLNRLREPKENWENKSIIEYDENHFHVDCFAVDEQEAFKLGIKTLILLSNKFERQNVSSVRFMYSFQSQELGRKEAIERDIHEEGDEYYVSDRLTFHRIRQNEEVIAADFFNNPYYAQLIVEI